MGEVGRNEDNPVGAQNARTLVFFVATLLVVTSKSRVWKEESEVMCVSDLMQLFPWKGALESK